MLRIFRSPSSAAASLPIAGSSQRSVRRIYCVGRNCVEHIREMKKATTRDPPFFFQKPADALVEDGDVVPYPVDTEDFQFEIELVVALGAGGCKLSREGALASVYGYAVGIDLTRRDRQREMRAKMLPWERGKSFDVSAPCGAIHRVAEVGHPARGAISLDVNGHGRQRGDLSQMIWSVPEIIANLSSSYRLAPGDLVMTGHPRGRRALSPGDHVTGTVEGVGRIAITIERARREHAAHRPFWPIFVDRGPLAACPSGCCGALAVWVIVNVEEWDPTETMPRTC